MLVFRREGKKIKVDIFDPHDDSRADAAEKPSGLPTSLASTALRSVGLRLSASFQERLKDCGSTRNPSETRFLG
jgi:hypothetical protein